MRKYQEEIYSAVINKRDWMGSNVNVETNNGITTFYQNEANYKNQEVMFDNIMDGNVYKKVNKAYDMMLQVA